MSLKSTFVKQIDNYNENFFLFVLGKTMWTLIKRTSGRMVFAFVFNNKINYYFLQTNNDKILFLF